MQNIVANTDDQLTHALIESKHSNILSKEIFKQLIDRLAIYTPLKKELLNTLSQTLYLLNTLQIREQTGLYRCARLLIIHSRQMQDLNNLSAWEDDLILLLHPEFQKTGLNLNGYQKRLEQYQKQKELFEKENIATNKESTSNVIQFLDQEQDIEKITTFIEKLLTTNTWENQVFSKLSQKIISIKRYDLLEQLIRQTGERFLSKQAISLKEDLLLNKIAILGSHYHEMGQYHEYLLLILWAKSIFKDSYLLDYHEGICRIAFGERDGWRLFSVRRNILKQLPPLIQNLKTWDGHSPVENLLIWWPEGASIGGEIMRLVFLPDIFKRVKNVGLICDQRLHSILKQKFPQIKCYPYSMLSLKTANCYDAEIDLISLTQFFLTPSYQAQPILSANTHTEVNLIEPLLDEKIIRCGISWFTPNKRSQIQRSIPAHILSDWIDSIDGVEFYALQHSLDECPEFKSYNSKINYLVNAEKDIDGLLHLAANMDIIVTIGNSTAHLAGALGIPTLVLLPQKPRFEWGIEGINMPFYKNMKLIRQEIPNDWNACLAEATRYIQQLKTAKSSPIA